MYIRKLEIWKFQNIQVFCFMLSTKQSQVENVAGNTLRKWQRCNFLELDTDWATHENILYIVYIYYEHLCISPYIGAHTPYIMWYTIYVAKNAPCVNKKEGTKSRKKRERRDTMYFILLLWPQHVCACTYVHVHTIKCMYIQIICRSGHSRFCWCQQRRRRKVFGNWTAFIGLGHAWAVADCSWVGIGTGRACVTLTMLMLSLISLFDYKFNQFISHISVLAHGAGRMPLSQYTHNTCMHSAKLACWVYRKLAATTPRHQIARGVCFCLTLTAHKECLCVCA